MPGQLRLIENPHDAGASPPADQASDTELVARAKAGDERAWVRLYELHYHEILSRVFYLLSGNPVAEDLVQDVFLVAWTQLDRFRGDSRFSSWLYGIALNQTRNFWRKARNHNHAINRLRHETAEQTHSPDRAHTNREQASAVLEAVSRLPDALREAFILVEFEGHSRTEAAEQIGVSPNLMGVRVFRARRRVASLLKKAGWEL